MTEVSASWSLVTYRANGRDRVGALGPDNSVSSIGGLEPYEGLIDLLHSWPEVETALRGWSPTDGEPLGEVELKAPIRYPSKLICAGANYTSHIEEMGARLPEGAPPPPYFFLKPPTTTVIGAGEPIRISTAPDSKVDWEGELAVVIGRTAHRISPAEAADHVAGYTLVNDISARGQHRRADAIAPPFEWDWLGSKGQDTFCPMGPGLTPSWLVGDPHGLTVRLWVNGDLKQSCPTSDMLVGVWDLVADASEIMTLEPGDVIATGTPPGVGAGSGEFLKPGDEVVVEIPGVGRLANPVAAIDH